MKKLLIIILSWFIFVQLSETTDFWVEYFEDEKSVHKCKRSDYLELMEQFELNAAYLDKIEKVKEYWNWEYNVR